jgi:hypothetical protein
MREVDLGGEFINIGCSKLLGFLMELGKGTVG